MVRVHSGLPFLSISYRLRLAQFPWTREKVFPPQDPFEEDPARIVFSSKEGGLFPVESQSPATFQRMELVDPSSGSRPRSQVF